MAKKLIGLCLVVLSCICMINIQAASVDDLYDAVVPLTGYKSANSKQVLQQGMLQVLVRVTGNRNILEHPAIEEALETPENYLLKYTQKITEKPEYINETDEVVTTKQLVSLQKFSTGRIERLLESSNIPVWGKQRPLALIWAMIEFGPQNRIVLNDTDYSHFNSYYKEIITTESKARGVPVAYPLQDLEEQIAISPSVIWAQFPEELTKASERYNTDVIVSVSMKSEQNQWVGKWLIINNGSTVEFETRSSQLNYSMQEGINWVADNLAKVYTTNLAAPAESIKIRINNVPNLANYVAVEKYISGLSVVDNYKLHHLGDNWLDLELNVKNGRNAFLDAIKLESRLVELKSKQSTVVKFKDLTKHIPNMQEDMSDDSRQVADKAASQKLDREVLEFRWRS